MNAPVYSREPIVVDVACNAGDIINLDGGGPCRVLTAHLMDDWHTLVTVEPAMRVEVDDEPEPWTFGDLEVGDWFDAFGYGGSPYCKVVSTWYDVGGLDALINAINSDGEPCRIPDGEEVWPFEWEWSE